MTTKKKDTPPLRSGKERAARAQKQLKETPTPPPAPLPGLPPALPPPAENPPSVNLSLDSVEISPINYRKYYDPVALAEFARGINRGAFTHPSMQDDRRSAPFFFHH